MIYVILSCGPWSTWSILLSVHSELLEKDIDFSSHRQLPSIGPGSQLVLHKCLSPINDDRRRRSHTQHADSIILSQVPIIFQVI